MSLRGRAGKPKETRDYFPSRSSEVIPEHVEMHYREKRGMHCKDSMYHTATKPCLHELE
ncbi:UNVERIFIED_CONTAM: hypothetical protein FKN15_069246 [Acipenser sinensis]